MNYLAKRSLIPIRKTTMHLHPIIARPTARTAAHVPSMSARGYTVSSRLSQPFPHTPDTYQKDETISEPSSMKTNVVGGQPEDDLRTQRPFESPTGAYTTMDASKPYDAPTTSPDEEHSKSRYGGVNKDGGTARGVNASDNPQDRGKTGRQ